MSNELEERKSEEEPSIDLPSKDTNNDPPIPLTTNSFVPTFARSIVDGTHSSNPLDKPQTTLAPPTPVIRTISQPSADLNARHGIEMLQQEKAQQSSYSSKERSEAESEPSLDVKTKTCRNPCNSMSQLGRFVSLIHVQKRRNIRITLCEYLSHIAIFLFLLLGFRLSIILNIPAGQHSTIGVPVPPPFFYDVSGPSPFTASSASSYGQFKNNSSTSARKDKSSQTSSTSIPQDPVSQLFTGLYAGGIGVNPLGVFNYITSTLMRGPIKVPSFDEYVTVALFLSSTIKKLNFPQFYLFERSLTGSRYSNLLLLGTLHFAPYPAPQTQALIDYMNATTSTFSKLKIRTHSSESEAVRWILGNLNERAWSLVVVRGVTRQKVNYVIRMNYTSLARTSTVLNRYQFGYNDLYQTYFYSGFVSLQQVIDDWVFNYTNTQSKYPPIYYNTSISSAAPPPRRLTYCDRPPSHDTFYIPYPTLKYQQNPFFSQVGFLLGFATVMATLYPVSRLIKGLVEEKESRMRELINIMGMPEYVYNMAWFLTAFILFSWIAATSTAIAHKSFLPKTSVVILFAYFFFFAMSEVSFSFFLSVFFNNSRLSAIVGPVVLFITVLPKYVFFGTDSNQEVSGKIIASLLSPTAYSFGADLLASYEYDGVGIQWRNIGDDDYSFATCLGMLIFDFFLYGLLAFYFDKVLPKEFGTPLPPNFFLKTSYWFGNGARCTPLPVQSPFGQSPQGDDEDESSQSRVLDVPESDVSTRLSRRVEIIAKQLRSSIKVIIQGLRKRYNDGKVAVKYLDLTLLEGQITCLLGANGAGKSTTISIMTGMITPTAGDIEVYGESLRYNLPKIRHMIGMCPQQNVQFDICTVKEHLYFFGTIKGLSCSELSNAVDEMMKDVGLSEKKDTIARNLSGGMRRKLSLAIALIGNPKLVLLDEPTSGMDPFSRRSVWELLQRRKKNCVMVLCTHYMFEADFLGDRIAIMSEGRLVCAGSPLFLKTRLGSGYILSVSKENSNCSIDEVTSFVESHLPNSKLSSAVAGEMNFQLSNDVLKFGDLLNALKNHRTELKIGSFGISLATLENVFVNLAVEAEKEAKLRKERGDDAKQDGWEEDSDDEVNESDGFQTRMIAAFKKSCIRGMRHIVIPERHTISQGSTIPLNSAGDVADEEKGLQMTISLSSSSARDTSQNPPSHGISLGLASPIAYSKAISDDFDQIEGDDISASQLPPSAADNFSSPFSKVVLHENESEIGNDVNSLDIATVTSAVAAPVPDNKDANQVAKSTKLYNQLHLLLYKRYICTLKDAKGFCFQIVFPALQIFLVLAILTITINPAGSTIKMNAGTFPFKPVMKVSNTYGEVSDSWIGSKLNEAKRMKLSNANLSSMVMNDVRASETSLLITHNMLNNFKSPSYGHFVINDSVRLNVSVNWDWVKAHFITIVKNRVLISQLARSAGIPVPSNSLLAGNIFLEGRLFPNQTVQRIAVNALLDSVVLPRNSSSRLQSLFKNASSIVRTASNDYPLGGSPTSFSSNSIIFPPPPTPNNTIIFTDVKLTVSNITFDLGNVSVDLTTFIQSLPGGNSYFDVDVPTPYTIMHNTSSPHAINLWNGELTESVFQQCVSDPSARYYVKNHPLPITTLQALEYQIILSLLAAIFILVPLCYVPAAFTSFLVKERSSKSKHLQFVSSVNPYMFWIAAYIYDMSMYIILVAAIMAAFYCYGPQEAAIFVSIPESAGTITLLLLIYGASVLPLSYLYSNLFENHSTALISIMAINFFTGFVFVLAYFIMSTIPLTQDAARQVRIFFLFFPAYNVGEGFIAVTSNYISVFYFGKHKSYLAWDVAGRNIIYMIIETFAYFTLVLLAESVPVKITKIYLDRLLISLEPLSVLIMTMNLSKAKQVLEVAQVEVENEDEDVRSERELVGASDCRDFPIFMKDLHKTYSPPSFSVNSSMQ